MGRVPERCDKDETDMGGAKGPSLDLIGLGGSRLDTYHLASCTLQNIAVKGSPDTSIFEIYICAFM